MSRNFARLIAEPAQLNRKWMRPKPLRASSIRSLKGGDENPPSFVLLSECRSSRRKYSGSGYPGSHPRITSDGHRLVLLLGAVQVWDLETRRKLGQTNPIAPLPSALALSDDGRFAVVGEGSELSVWRLEHIVGGRPEPARGASATAIVEDEEVPIAVVATSQTLEGWDLGTGDRLWQRPGSGALDLAPVPGRGAVVAGRWDGAVELVNARSGASCVREWRLLQPVDGGDRDATATKDRSG